MLVSCTVKGMSTASDPVVLVVLDSLSEPEVLDEPVLVPSTSPVLVSDPSVDPASVLVLVLVLVVLDASAVVLLPSPLPVVALSSPHAVSRHSNRAAVEDGREEWAWTAIARRSLP